MEKWEEKRLHEFGSRCFMCKKLDLINRVKVGKVNINLCELCFVSAFADDIEMGRIKKKVFEIYGDNIQVNDDF